MMAIVTFSSRLECEEAIKELHGKFVINNIRLSLNWGKLENEQIIEGKKTKLTS